MAPPSSSGPADGGAGGLRGLVVDGELVDRAPRQAPSLVDSAALANVRTALLEAGIDLSAFIQVTRISHANMDDPPVLDSWRLAFEPPMCADHDSVTAGCTLARWVSGRVTIDPTSFDAARVDPDAAAPDQPRHTFASVAGFTRWSVTAGPASFLSPSRRRFAAAPRPQPARTPVLHRYTFSAVSIHSIHRLQGGALNEWQAGRAPPTSTGTCVDGMSGFAFDVDTIPDMTRGRPLRYPCRLSGLALIP